MLISLSVFSFTTSINIVVLKLDFDVRVFGLALMKFKTSHINLIN